MQVWRLHFYFKQLLLEPVLDLRSIIRIYSVSSLFGSCLNRFLRVGRKTCEKSTETRVLLQLLIQIRLDFVTVLAQMQFHVELTYVFDLACDFSRLVVLYTHFLVGKHFAAGSELFSFFPSNLDLKILISTDKLVKWHLTSVG